MRCVSLFAGIGGFDLGFERAGIETVAVVEKDANCRKLLAAKFPRAAVFDDVATVGKHNLPEHDVLLFGFPCQDVSQAGLRAGLAGKRTGLYFEATRIADECRTPVLLWENVPGLLSSTDGRDLLAVFAELDRLGYAGAWRTFDAQHFGVAQRRRRIFGCFTRLDLGASGCAEVLSLPQGVRWNPPPRREAGKRPSGTLAARTKGGGGLGTDLELDGGLQVAGALDTAQGGADENDAEQGRLVPDVVGPLVSGGDGHSAGGATLQDACSNLLLPDVANALTAGGGQRNNPFGQDTWIPEVADPISANEAKTYTNEGKNNFRLHNVVPFDTTQLTHPENRSNPQVGDPAPTLAKGGHAPAIAFSSKDSGADAGELSPTLRAGNHSGSHSNGGVPPAVTSKRGVRRLTPIECERLQGFPDGWTLGFADATRYKMLGNAVAVPVAEWLGRRIKRVFSL